MTQSVRLDKRVAELAGCSRQQARRYIEGGWVSVAGCVVEAPQTLVSDQPVLLAEDARDEPAAPATVVLHKPGGVPVSECAALIRPASRSADDASAVRMLGRHFRHLMALMPLDEDAQGLLVLSQDTAVQRRLTESAALIEQEFIVSVEGDLDAAGLERLRHGLRYQARALPPCKVSWQSEQRLRFALKAVRPGQLRHMCQQLGLQVTAIKRIRVGSIPLGKMAAGEWRHLVPGQRF